MTGRRRAGERRRSQRGSVLMLMPVGVLIMVMLGAVMVDFARAHLAARELGNLAAAVADDAAIVGISEERFQEDGLICLDLAKVEDNVQASWNARRPDRFEVHAPEHEIVSVDVDDATGEPVPGVRVTGTGRVATIFAAAAPFGFTHHEVSGASTSVIGGQQFDADEIQDLEQVEYAEDGEC